MNPIERHLRTERDLHKMLNSHRAHQDMDAMYDRLRLEQKEMSAAAHRHLDTQGHLVDMHDGRIKDFSARRKGNAWHTRFSADVIAYGRDSDGDDAGYSGRGYVRVGFDLDATSSARALSGCEIHTFLLNEPDQEMGFLVHNKVGGMDVVIVPYSRMEISKGPVRTWGELSQAQHAVGPFRAAEIIIAHEKGEDRLPARWYDSGYLEVKSAEGWEDWGEYAFSLYDSSKPSVSSVQVTSADGIASSSVSANSRRGGQYAQRPDRVSGASRRLSP